MIFSKCIQLKSLIVRYNKRQSRNANRLEYEFSSYRDGEWSCCLKCSGCVDLVDFTEIYVFITSLFVAPFAYSSKFGLRVHIL